MEGRDFPTLAEVHKWNVLEVDHTPQPVSSNCPRLLKDFEAMVAIPNDGESEVEQ